MAKPTDLVFVQTPSRVIGPLMRSNADSLAIQLALQGQKDVKISRKEN